MFSAREWAMIIRGTRLQYDKLQSTNDITQGEEKEFKELMKKLETAHWEQYKKEGE